MQARTINEILTEVLAEKATMPELAILTNPSNASIWYNLLAMFSVEVNIMENLADQLIEDVESRVFEIPSGTILWYAVETLNYQFGDSLSIIDGLPQYAVIDDTKRVVKQSACTEQSGALIVKAGKTDGSGNTIPLIASELSGLQQYWLEKRFAGVNLSVISINADLIKSYVDIQIEGQLLSLTGESLTDAGVYPVIDAVKEYYKDIDFGGEFRVMDLVDVIQNVKGTKNVVAKSILAKPYTGGTWAEIMDDNEQNYISLAGYLSEDPTDTLSTTLNYYI